MIKALQVGAHEALVIERSCLSLYFNDLRISSSASESKDDWKIFPL